MVLFHLEDRDSRVRTNDGIDASIENLCQVLRFLCRPFLTHNQNGANQKHSQRPRARPQQARNRPPTGCGTSPCALPTLAATFLFYPITQLTPRSTLFPYTTRIRR